MSNFAHSYADSSTPRVAFITLTEAASSAYGVELLDDAATRNLSLVGIDAITGQRGVTALRPGISMIAIPDTAFSNGLSGRTLRERLRQWRKLIVDQLGERE